MGIFIFWTLTLTSDSDYAFRTLLFIPVRWKETGFSLSEGKVTGFSLSEGKRDWTFPVRGKSDWIPVRGKRDWIFPVRGKSDWIFPVREKSDSESLVYISQSVKSSLLSKSLSV
jgi:hypothetical protein